MAEEKKRYVLWTPVGRISFPQLDTPDTGRENSDNKYKADLLINKATFQKEGKAITDAIMAVGKAKFGDKFDLKSGKYKHPVKDMDKDDDVQEMYKGMIHIRAKNKVKPEVYHPTKNSAGQFGKFTDEEIRKIKGGDWVRFYVNLWAYDNVAKGVGMSLIAVQFWKADTAFGGGVASALETMSELEVTPESMSLNEAADSVI